MYMTASCADRVEKGVAYSIGHELVADLSVTDLNAVSKDFVIISEEHHYGSVSEIYDYDVTPMTSTRGPPTAFGSII